MGASGCLCSFCVTQPVSSSSVTGSTAKLRSWQGCAGPQMQDGAQPLALLRWPGCERVQLAVLGTLPPDAACLCLTFTSRLSRCCKQRAVLPPFCMIAAEGILHAASSQGCAVGWPCLHPVGAKHVVRIALELLLPAGNASACSVQSLMLAFCLWCCDRACFSVCRSQADLGMPASRGVGLMWTTMSEAAALLGMVTCTSDSSCASW